MTFVLFWNSDFKKMRICSQIWNAKNLTKHFGNWGNIRSKMKSYPANNWAGQKQKLQKRQQTAKVCPQFLEANIGPSAMRAGGQEDECDEEHDEVGAHRRPDGGRGCCGNGFGRSARPLGLIQPCFPICLNGGATPKRVSAWTVVGERLGQDGPWTKKLLPQMDIFNNNKNTGSRLGKIKWFVASLDRRPSTRNVKILLFFRFFF